MKTDKPMKKSISLIGAMPISLANGNCNSVIKENKITLQIEVCGLEKVSLKDSDKVLSFNFTIDKEPREFKMTANEVKSFFQGGS